MTEEEKQIEHINALIDDFNDFYKDYKNTAVQDKGMKLILCRVLVGCLFGLLKDFNELEKYLYEVAE